MERRVVYDPEQEEMAAPAGDSPLSRIGLTDQAARLMVAGLARGRNAGRGLGHFRFTYDDLAKATGLTIKHLKNLRVADKFDPGDFASVAAFLKRRWLAEWAKGVVMPTSDLDRSVKPTSR